MNRILINFEYKYIKTLLVKDGDLIDIVIDDVNELSIINNIYYGKITKILKNGFVFIDINESKNAFLNLNDTREKDLLINKEGLFLKCGQYLPVQVIKDSYNNKGPLVTSQIKVNDGYVNIYKENNNKIIFPKTFNKSIILDMKQSFENILSNGYSIIINDILEINIESIKNDVFNLIDRYNKIIDEFKDEKKIINSSYNKSFLYKNFYLFRNINIDIQEVIIDSESHLEEVIGITNKLLGKGVLVKLNNNNLDLLSEYFVKTQFERALNKKVWLKSGGFIVIEYTEACTVIDINTGKYSNNKSSKMKTNVEATLEIAKQIRLRNISGIIIIDYINMSSIDEVKIIELIKNEMKKDFIKSNIVGITELGLMQITREKKRKSLFQSLK